jgi:hypothetical protein
MACIQWNHLPAIFTASAELLSLIYPVFFSTRKIMLLYGLPDRIAQESAAVAPWWAGQLRTQAGGILCGYFYWKGWYEVCDAFMVVLGLYLGVGDLLVMWYCGKLGYGVQRLVGSLAVATCGLVGMTQW